MHSIVFLYDGLIDYFVVIEIVQLGLPDVREEHMRTDERPFSSENKWMAVKCRKRHSTLDGVCTTFTIGLIGLAMTDLDGVCTTFTIGLIVLAMTDLDGVNASLVIGCTNVFN